MTQVQNEDTPGRELRDNAYKSIENLRGAFWALDNTIAAQALTIDDLRARIDDLSRKVVLVDDLRLDRDELIARNEALRLKIAGMQAIGEVKDRVLAEHEALLADKDDAIGRLQDKVEALKHDVDEDARSMKACRQAARILAAALLREHEVHAGATATERTTAYYVLDTTGALSLYDLPQVKEYRELAEAAEAVLSKPLAD